MHFWPFALLVAGFHLTDGFRAKSRRKHTWRARMEAVNQEQPNFPGPHANLRTGLALSGGGVRAMAWSMGVLRALDGLGFMDKVDGISSVSGGGWAAAPYMFSNIEKTTLLGRFTEPGELTLEAINTRDGVLTDAVNESTKRLLARYIVVYPNHEVWERVVAKAVLEPFGLGDRFKYMAASAERVAELCALNPSLSPDDFDVPQPGRPRAFIMNGILAAPHGLPNVRKELMSFQMSPDYTGSPFWPGYDGSLKLINYSNRIQNVARGGGFVETFAFGGGAPRGAQYGSRVVDIVPPSRPFSLSLAVAISSAMRFWPHWDVWPVLPDGSEPQAEIEHELTDGGIIENTGLHTLLQRGASKVVSVISTSTPMDSEVDFCAYRSEASWAELGAGCGSVACSLTALFGYTYRTDVYNYDHAQVFERSAMPGLLCSLQRLRRAGKPAVASTTVRLVDNAWWGIRGGRDVQLLVVYLEVCTDFEQALAADTQQALKSDNRFAAHPHYSTFENTDPIYLKLNTANLLAAQGEYFVRQNEQLFRELLQ